MAKFVCPLLELATSPGFLVGQCSVKQVVKATARVTTCQTASQVGSLAHLKAGAVRKSRALHCATIRFQGGDKGGCKLPAVGAQAGSLVASQ